MYLGFHIEKKRSDHVALNLFVFLGADLFWFKRIMLLVQVYGCGILDIFTSELDHCLLYRYQPTSH
jgi:hypothetical protein